MIIRTHNAIKSNSKINCMSNTTNTKYKKHLHQGYKIQQGHKYVVLKIMQQNLKVLKKKKLQSKNIKDNIEYRLKVLNQST